MAKEIQDEISAEVMEFVDNNVEVPCLAAVLVGENPASEVYVRHKREACQRVGIDSQLHRLPATASQDELLTLIAKLNRAKESPVHGILVQLPLPPQIDTGKILQAVSPLKDVDCFHAENVGRLVQGRPRFLPCTPHGVVQMLKRSQIATAGKRVVIVGRSDIVGKPLANMLLQRGADATVTVCHSRTENLAAVCREADILVAAIGVPRFITAEMVRPGATVIDVGINRVDGKLCGDVDFEAVREVAGAITPVPRGIGPLTVTMLLANTLHAAREQQQ